jgi:hypothetical protein
MARCCQLRASRGERGLKVWQPLTVTSLHGDQLSGMGLVSYDPADFDVLSVSCAQLTCLNQAQLSDSSWCHLFGEFLANGGLE